MKTVGATKPIRADWEFLDSFVPTQDTGRALRMGRRGFLKVCASAGGGLLLGVYLPAGTLAADPVAAKATATLGLFVRMDPDGHVVIGSRCPEIGQGVKTALPMMIAEEMDANWEDVEVEQLPLGLVFGGEPPGVAWKYGAQGAGGSTSIPGGWEDLRQAGAKVRRMLLEAAARQWNANVESLRTDSGRVFDASGRSLGYGELAATAALIPLPVSDQPLKTPEQYRIIGTARGVVDAHAIVTGNASYGIDVKTPGMLIAVIARCPLFEGGVKRFDAEAALAVAGVRQVLLVPGPKGSEPITQNLVTGVAVLADDTWAALKGREALQVEWTSGGHEGESTQSLDVQCAQLLAGKGQVVRNDGDVDAARKASKRAVDATYRIPFVAHAPLEPPGAYVEIKNDSMRIIASMQQPGGASRVAHAITGIDRKNIEVIMTRAGGGFGRRLSNDFVAEAVWLAKASGKAVKLMWTREDDLAHDYFRPFGHHHLTAVLDADGMPVGWRHHLASASKYHRRADVKPDELWTAELYADDFPAGIVKNLRIEWSAVKSGMTRGSWRAPAHTANAFVVQSFLDEIAHAGKQDPVELRIKMLDHDDMDYAQHGGPKFSPRRLREVTRIAAEKIGWKRTLPTGRGLGIAAHFTFGGYAAHAIEVGVDTAGALTIHRCICVVDVGQPINTLGLEAQMMGGTIDGLSTAMRLEIHIDKGRVLTKNFPDYPLLRSAQAPDVDVHIVASRESPSGAGEMGIPTVAPALTNAIFAATGVRLRSLPIGNQLVDAMRQRAEAAS